MNPTFATLDSAALRIADFTLPNSRPVNSRPAMPSAPAPARTPEQPKQEPKSKLRPNTKADAPLTTIGRKLTAGIHLAVLLGLVAFVGSQLMLAASAKKRQAVVRVVAPNLQQVTSPVDGVFTAVDNMPNGTQVKKGDIMGYVTSLTHDADLAATQQELIALRQRKLMLRGISGNSQSEETRDVAERIAVLKAKLAMLRSTSQNLCITSPVDGRIEQGFSGTQSVRRNDTLAHVWGEGDDLLVEVEAPLNVIHRLVKKGNFQATFDTPTGAVQVAATTIAHSLKTIERKVDGKRSEIWGSLQCRPETVPTAVATPGAIGRL